MTRTRCLTPRTERELAAVEAYVNFLSWGEHPTHGGRHVPPAWWAYVMGASKWCPPAGEW